MPPASTLRRVLLASALALVLLVLPGNAEAEAQTGGAAPSPPAAEPDANGGADRDDATRTRRRRSSGRPVLQSFAVSPPRFYLDGPPARVAFRISDRSSTVRVRLDVMGAHSGRLVRRIDLGDRATGVPHTYALGGREGGPLPQGSLRLRLSARDPGGKLLRTSARASGVGGLDFRWHRFPVAGPFTYSGGGGLFGAPRPGRVHQGQDLAAAEGTPLVAPRGGLVEAVGYQASGAGNYVVIDGEGEDRDYAFMHLQTGSTRVRVGQRVLTGQRIGSVGNTGYSFGPHLHFEIWVGGWHSGGQPIDPLPHLRRWDSWS